MNTTSDTSSKIHPGANVPPTPSPTNPATRPTMTPGSVYPQAEHFAQPNPARSNQAVMVGGIAVGVGLLVVGLGFFLGGSSGSSPASANAVPATNYFTEQQKLMREAMDMAKEAQQLQRERMDNLRREMEMEREGAAEADGSFPAHGE